jgi:DnaK suppressor protein
VPGNQEYADLLDERLASTRTLRAALTTAIEDMVTSRSLTFSDDEHDPDGSTVSLDQARDTALLRRTERTLSELVAARERLEAGRYGRCERCDQPIPHGRLLARPEARLCVPCSGRHEW